MKLANLKLDRSGPFSLPLVAAFLLLFSLSLAPAQTQRLAKVGYLGFGTAVPPALFQNRMRELGYSEGKDISVEYRFADGRPETSGLGPRTGRRQGGCHHGYGR